MNKFYTFKSCAYGLKKANNISNGNIEMVNKVHLIQLVYANVGIFDNRIMLVNQISFVLYMGGLLCLNQMN